jgi:hypothetical protein
VIRMKFIHYELNYVKKSTWVEVVLSAQANVGLIDQENYHLYKNGEKFTMHGGWATTSPVRLQVPYDGVWQIIVDLGGYKGNVKATCKIIS